MIDREVKTDAAALCGGHDLPREVELVCFDERFAHFEALSLEEGVCHAAADEDGVHLGEQVLDDFNLV